MSVLKWITGGIGFVMGGPIGALLGLGAGFVLEGLTSQNGQKFTAGPRINSGNRTARNDFTLSFLVLIAAVIKADGKVHRAELDFVRGHFIALFGPVGAEESMRVLNGIIGRSIPTEQVCLQIRQNMDYSSRLELLHLLYGVATADGEFASSEKSRISQIAHDLGLNSADSASIEAMFDKQELGPYKILEVDSSASDDEVKKAYRTMAQKFHPDKVAHLGEEYQNQAQEKFRRVNEAYDKIKSQRNMS